MGAVPDETQELQLPELDLLEGFRDPPFVGRYDVSCHLHNSLAHLVGVAGKYSRLLRCDSYGMLGVRVMDNDGATGALVDAPGSMHVSLYYGATPAVVQDYSVISTLQPGLTVVDYYSKQNFTLLDNIYDILDDVHDAVNHCLKVDQIT